VEQRPFRTFDDTLTYCYHVAGCVGVMMAVVMGVDPADRATLERACDLGLAFQLDNIARDVIEDAAHGRCYLPEDWLAEVGLTAQPRHPRESGDPSPDATPGSTARLPRGDLQEMGPRFRGDDEGEASSPSPVVQEMGPRFRGDDAGERFFAAPHNRAALATVVARLVDEAERYAASARHGTAALPWRSAWAVLAAADIYGGIGRRVRAEGVAALDRRVTTSRAEKLAAVARALPAALSRRRSALAPSRAGLWTPPLPGPL
ncbi:MAG: squalene/phytoene synthase family protein, partial [Sphingomonadaceae bacterium]|nr:squalene/phytoene synthase family protein [Sphingomonadaceae bacterium]